MAMNESGYSGGFFTPPPAGSALGDLAAALATAMGAGGVGLQIAQAASGSTAARGPRFANVPGTAHLGALSRYTSRLLAQNADTMPPTFQEFLQSGGTARFNLQGADQFSPLEAVQLGLTSKRGKIPWYDPAQQYYLTPEQEIFLRQQRRRRRRQNDIRRQRGATQGGGGGGGGGGGSNIRLDVGANIGAQD